jgi:hypothetical protein
MTSANGKCCVEGLGNVGGSLGWEFRRGLWVELEEECCREEVECCFCDVVKGKLDVVLCLIW